ncbi:MAG: large subunit ribosomal protein [Patescibacteria group bacterium]|nr:large subunit ribosomal protein [Patescibacteria group bacterium]
MGKIRTRFIGIEEIEKQQKEDQKKRSSEKKVEKGEEENQNQEVKVETSNKKSKKKDKKLNVHVRGKKYQEALKKIDEKKEYQLQEAVETLKKITFAKFEESVELHINVLNEGLRGEIELPHSTGKTVRVAIVSDTLLETIDKGIIDFDILIAHPSFMPKLAKYAKTLGPKGLMPNPKAGTISPNPEEAAKKFEKGMLRWKSESKFPIVHQLIGKLPHETNALVENATAFLNSVGRKNIKNAFIKSTMSPSLKLNLENIG